MYSVKTCGTCQHERRFAYESPCNECYELRSSAKQNFYVRQEGLLKECEETGKACDYGNCGDCGR